MELNKPFCDSVKTDTTQSDLAGSANMIKNMCHGVAVECGWWEDEKKRNVPTLLMLCVSELAEAMEGDRKSLMDDHLPHREMLEVELADAIIRIFDMAGGLNLDIGGAIAEKLKYNTERNDHRLDVRENGGKSY